MSRYLAHILPIIALLPSALVAEDWSRFRGNNGSGVSYAKKSLPSKWSEEENITWRHKLPGPGSSSPIVVGDCVIVTCYSGYTNPEASIDSLQHHVICIDRASGKKRWQQTLEKKSPTERYNRMLGEHGYASSTPTSDGRYVFAFWGKWGCAAYSLNDGKPVWHKSLGTGSALNRWGSATSPIIYKDLLIVNANAESEKVCALKTKDGSIAWEAKAGGAYGSWSTPIIASQDGHRDELIVSVPYELWSLNPRNGRLRWYADSLGGEPVNPSPVFHQGVVYAIGGRRGSGRIVAIKTGGEGDAKKNVVWSQRGSVYVPSPTFYKGHLYLVSDRGIAHCFEASSGKPVYEKRLEGVTGRNGVYASIVIGDGKIYSVTRRDGVLVLSTGPELKVISHNRIKSDESQFNASPAVSDGQLFIRSDTHMYCIGKRSH